ncbi:ATP-binding cassette domain-containing protein [Desulfofundulus sp. TPOSR]|jgi:cobalt/nickel transport system ATP-binding protein|uniref:ATP-binding cassette domain-containing protein n=1 Tax=Desulfofundulus sp. TPOSR TaxID=2714340 RepID=UPI00140D1938|nr:ATP-binding cassette domain-containing protein [Desulfofundulus sp. TPOSR]NHM26037.1 ATP-binding cassette domain-containing protein [Desulfofundulus sp. TPOSR]
MAAVIEVEDLHYTYRDGTRALQGLSLSIPRGSRVALLGPNGAGKSTLLMHLNGLYLPQRGKVRVMGQDVNARTAREIKSRVGLVFQDPDDQVFSSTVGEDVAFGPVNMGLPAAEVERRVQESLAAVQMEAYRDKPPYHLSYGQKKRVAIAGVLAMGPEIIVLDEPMAYLDPQGKDTLLDILDRLHRRGATILVATHDVDMAAGWADRVVIMKNGRTLAQGDPSLLVREDIIRQANLRFPLVAQIFRSLPELQLKTVPYTVEQAAALLKDILAGHRA